MNWFYVMDGQQAGPVPDAQLDELLASGKITPQTLVWREGMAGWEPWQTARPATVTVEGQTGVKCTECGKVFPSDELIRLGQSWVCASCKPVFLQRLQEGAAPSAVGGGLWRMNKQLVTRPETPFPDRCVRCNAPANGYRLKRELTWHPWPYYLFVVLNLIIYIIVALCVRKKAIVHIGLCEKHRARRMRGIVICTIGVVGGFAMIFIGGMMKAGPTAGIGILLLLGGTIYGMVARLRVFAAKINSENVWIKGVNKDFLAELPEWPER